MYNFKYLVGGAALVLATSAIAGGPELPPAPVENSGFYIGVNGGLSLLANYNNNNNFNNGALVNGNGFIAVNGVNAFQVPYNYQTAGWNAGGAIGYRFNAWRVEVEGSYMQHSANGNARNLFIAVNGPFVAGTLNVNDLEIVTVLANGYYDFDMGNNFVPYVGLGLGWGQTQSRFNFFPVAANGGFNTTWTRNGFAFQGVLGLDYKITDNVRLGIAYHAVGITGGNNNNRVFTVNGVNNFVFGNGNGTGNNNNFLFENKINLGLSYFF